jgi:hypothetical protein
MSENPQRQRNPGGTGSTEDVVSGPAFSQVARQELDELLEQLARDVQDAQGRLRGLLRAYLAVAHAGDLDMVLRPSRPTSRWRHRIERLRAGAIGSSRDVWPLHTDAVGSTLPADTGSASREEAAMWSP